MLDAIAAARPIRLPAPAARRLAAVRRAEAELRRAGSAPVTAEAMAGRTGLSAATVRSLRETPLVSASLDDPVGEDGASLRDLVAEAGRSASTPADPSLIRPRRLRTHRSSGATLCSVRSPMDESLAEADHGRATGPHEGGPVETEGTGFRRRRRPCGPDGAWP